MIAKVNISSEVGGKLAGLAGVTEGGVELPEIRIVDPNPGKNNIIKYRYERGEGGVVGWVERYGRGEVR